MNLLTLILAATAVANQQRSATQSLSLIDAKALQLAWTAADAVGHAMEIPRNSKLVVSIGFDGTVMYGDGITPTEAAAAFYKEVARLVKMPCEAVKASK